MTVMKTLLAGAVLASTMALTVPASAQSIGLGPDGPSIDLRSRAQRERDFRREEMRRRDYEDDRAYYREQRFRDERRSRRRDYDY